MVDLKTAIEEINNGIIVFKKTKKHSCTTEGEVVIYLKRLEDFENMVEVEKNILREMNQCYLNEIKRLENICKENGIDTKNK